MGKRSRGSSDELPKITLTDFSAGVNSMFGWPALSLNEATIFNTQNVLGFPGRVLYAGGFRETCPLTAADADAAYEFYDVARIKHHVVWRGGNMYDTVSGAETLIAAGIYTAGDPVGRVDQGGKLYYVSPDMPLRSWDGTTEGPVVGIDIPRGGTYMTAFAGSLIVANPTNQVGVYVPSAFVPSAVNDPTNWLWANAQTVGTDFNGIISFIMPMGVSSTGIPATKSMIVGKTAGNLFLYTGAIGQQSEAIVNCTVGCLDALSAVYVPAPTLFGQVIFLGTDGQLWGCDGVIAEPLTQEKNLQWVFSLVSGAQIINTGQKFSATYNDRFSYYLLDVGQNMQLVWMWKTKALFPLRGWPSGIYFKGHDGASFSSNFVAANQWYAAGVYQVGMDFTDFNGQPPVISYQTPFLHAGDAERTKDYLWAALASRNVGASYKVVAETLTRFDNTKLTSNPIYFNDPAIATIASQAGVWDQSQWDQAMFAPDSINADPTIRHAMLSVPVPASEWVPEGVTQPLRSGAVSFTISWNPLGQLPPAFDISLFQVRYQPRSMRTSGNDKYIAESSNISTDTDPWAGVLS